MRKKIDDMGTLTKGVFLWEGLNESTWVSINQLSKQTSPVDLTTIPGDQENWPTSRRLPEIQGLEVIDMIYLLHQCA